MTRFLPPFGRQRARAARSPWKRLRPHVEPLENRLALNMTFSVTSNLDDGHQGTLRWAIDQANENPNSTITFGITTGPPKITLASGLPAIKADNVTIDGFSQGTSSFTGPTGPAPLVEIDGSSLADGSANGIIIEAANCVVEGLAITGFQTHSNNNGVGILLDSVLASKDTITGNYLGLDTFGGTAGNGLAGILIIKGSGTTITNNVISANGGDGIQVGSLTFASAGSASSIAIQGNLLGTDPSGDAASGFGNGHPGIFVDAAQQTQIGGQTASPGTGVGNVISGNGTGGVSIDPSSSRTTIQGNLIGVVLNMSVTPPVTVLLPNKEGGVFLSGASNTLIGGPRAGGGNVIFANGAHGINVTGNSSGSVIQGNLIGLDAGGDNATGFGNHDSGVFIDGAQNTRVGGPNAGEGNTISGNGSGGVSINPGSIGTVIQGNRIGTDSGSTMALANHDAGVFLRNALNTLIGGTAPGDGNVISGNGTDGIQVTAGSPETVIQGNLIGTDKTGTVPLRNQHNGVFLDGATGTLVGGTVANAGNTISANVQDGVFSREQARPATRCRAISSAPTAPDQGPMEHSATATGRPAAISASS
jgi:titin